MIQILFETLIAVKYFYVITINSESKVVKFGIVHALNNNPNAISNKIKARLNNYLITQKEGATLYKIFKFAITSKEKGSRKTNKKLLQTQKNISERQ